MSTEAPRPRPATGPDETVPLPPTPADDGRQDLGFIPGFDDESQALNDGDTAHDRDHTPEQQGRRRRAAGFAGRVVAGAMAHHADYALNGALAHETETIKGARTSTRVKVDPVTGREKTITETRLSPIIPALKAVKESEAQEYNWHNGERSINHEHPWFSGIGSSMGKGDIRTAYDQIVQIERNLQHGEAMYVGPVGRGLNALLNKMNPDLSRPQRIKTLYEDSLATAYHTAMSAGYNPDAKNPRMQPASREVESQDWSAVLDPRNVQALRSHISDKYRAQNKDVENLNSSIRNGALHLVAPAELAAYLGVDPKDLARQTSVDGEQDPRDAVVPPLVLSKLRFLLLFAGSTKLAEDGTVTMPRQLATFIGRDCNRPVEAAEDTSPVERMLQAGNGRPVRRGVSREEIARRTAANERQDAARREAEKRKARTQGQEDTLDYVEKLFEESEPRMSLADLKAHHQKIELERLIAKNGLTPNQIRNLSEGEKEELKAEAADKANRIAETNYELLKKGGYIGDDGRLMQKSS